MTKLMEKRIATVEAIHQLDGADHETRWYTCPVGADVFEFCRACEVKAKGRHFTLLCFLNPGDPRPRPHRMRTDIVMDPNAADY